MKLGEIAVRVEGQAEGDAQIDITGVAGLQEARPGEITFLANRRYRPLVEKTRASAIIVSRSEEGISLPCIRTDDPYLAFAKALEIFYEPPRYSPSVHSTAVISRSAQIGEGAHIGAYCFVDDDVVIGCNAVLHSFVAIYRGVRIGDDFWAHSHAVVREGCRIGHRVILQNGVVVGGDGFGFAREKDGRWRKIPQSGPVIIGDDVEIQSNSSVDRATVGETIVANGAKIDSLVQIGHACKVGENALLCGQVGLAGSTIVGKGCILAGQVGAAGHLEIGDGAVLTAQSGVPNDVPPRAIYSGYPAMENKNWLRSVAAFQQLPELQRKLRELETEMLRLTGKSAH